MNKVDILMNCRILGNEIIMPNEMCLQNEDEANLAGIELQNLGGVFNREPTPRFVFTEDPSSDYSELMMKLVDKNIANEYLNRKPAKSNKPLIDQFMIALDNYIESKMVVINQSEFESVKELKHKYEVKRLLSLLLTKAN